MALIQVKKCPMCGAEIPVLPSAREVACPVCGSRYDVLYGESQQLKKHAIIISTLADGYVKDTEMPLTVNKASGLAEITKAHASIPELGIITSAFPGDLISLDLFVRNIGDRDYIWVTAKDIDTGRQIVNNKGEPFGFQGVHESSDHWGWGQTGIVMPDRDFRILFEAGHEKRW